ncbi:MAG: hypothetical protein A2X47_03715 [Lentisphaerae bacterium GWF2_38_69]|nr:MAG: hypothetical protein A2X47_03715 [Lentisphaerae bacterium GWF2_38_69]
MYAQLKKGGFEIEKHQTCSKLDLIIINTCSVTSSASQKSRQYARSMKEKHPGAVIVVTGCDTEVDREKWSEAGVDIVVPNSQKTNILSYIRNKFDIPLDSINQNHSERFDIFIQDSSGLFPFKSRANLKIQDGCDAFCTYCIVPYGRGNPRSREWNDTLREFRELIAYGFKEIVLTGVNIATYNDSRRSLIDLLKEMLAEEPATYRIRLGSTEPQFSMKGLIETIASESRICRFLHLPLQHGANKILQAMGRSYSREEFADFVREAVRVIPDICIGSDVIVGFPGETDDDFQECLNFLKSLPLAYLHVFGYSKREGTPAASYENQISPKIIMARHKILTELASELSTRFLSKQVNKTFMIIPEKESEGVITGWTDNYIKACVAVDRSKAEMLMKEPFLKVKLTGLGGYREMRGELA